MLSGLQNDQQKPCNNVCVIFHSIMGEILLRFHLTEAYIGTTLLKLNA